MASHWLSMDTFTSYYNSVANSGDHRISHLPMMKTPWLPHAIVLMYLFFVLKVGPRMMERRAGYQFKKLLIVYNIAMVVYNFFLWYTAGIYGWFGHYSLKCQPLDPSDSVAAVGMAYGAYFFMLSKYIELLDTVFFVLRKKTSQVTLLHVWHHTFMCISYYWGIKFYPGGHGSFAAFVNSGIHVLMYSYYGLAALGPSRTLLALKPYLTILQQIQFVAIFIHSMQLCFIDCPVPKSIVLLTLVNASVFFGLFRDFFVKSYVRRSQVKETPVAVERREKAG